MSEFDLLLFDRITKIKSINEQYDLLNNGYISFSGGKDSVILSHLVDLALPNNKIPRLFLNTGIEYIDIVKFVKELAEQDERIVIYNNTTDIRKMLKEFGYPFKSKQHSHNMLIYQNNKEECRKYIEMAERTPKLLKDYDWIHNLPLGVKTIVKYYFGVRERERELYFFEGLP